MQFFYRIFRKNKVLLRKRKIPIMSSQGKVDSLNSPLATLAAAATSTATATSSPSNSGIGSGGESSKATAGNSAKRIKTDVPDRNSTTRCGVAGSAAVSSSTEKCRRENHAPSMNAPVGERSHAAQSQLRHQRQEPKSPKKVDFPGNKQRQLFDNRPQVANCGRQIGPQVLPSSPQSQQQPPPPRRHETINVTAKDVKQILEELKEKTAAAAEAAAAKVEEDRRPSGNVESSNQQRKGPQTTQASANSVASKISQEQKLAIRNFRLGGGQQVQQSSATSAASASIQGDSEKILSIVSNLHKKQVEKQQQQQQNLCNSVPRTVSGGVHSGLSPKTTIQKTTVSSIQFGTMKHSLSAPSAKNPDTMSPRVNKSASLVVQNQQQQQPVSAVSAMERHLAKTLPSGTAVTVKVAAAAAAAARAAGVTSNDKPYNNRDGIITPILKKDALSGGGGPRTDSVRKSLSDRSFINVSEALMKQKTVLSCASVGGGGGGAGMLGQQQVPMPRPAMSAMFKTTVPPNVVRGNSTPPPPRTSGVASQPTAVAVAPSLTAAMRNQFPARVSATTTTTPPPPSPPTTTTNASTVAAAFPSLSATVAANSQSPQLAAMTAAVAVANLEAASTPDSLAIQTQIPKNRLEVKLQPSVPVPHNSVLNASSAVLAQPQQIISFRKQPPVAELLWSGPPVTTAAAAVANIVHKDASGSSVVVPRKTLNQGIRQIPNPSLLTNKQKNGTGTGDLPGTAGTAE